MTVKSMLQREQVMRRKEHWPPKCVVRPPFSLFTCLATTQQRLVTSPRDPGVVSLHVNAGHFSTTASRVTSPAWGPPLYLLNLASSNPHLKARVHLNLIKILGSLKREKRLWNTTRQLPDPTMAPQVFGQLFGVYLPIFNFKLQF